MSVYPTPNESFGELLRNLMQEFSTLIRQHIELGKTELKEDATHWSQTAALFVGAALFAQIGILFVGIALMFVLFVLMPAWLASFMIAVLFFAAAGGLAWKGRQQIKQQTESSR
jgi:uncharacterized membrane protein YqjE